MFKLFSTLKLVVVRELTNATDFSYSSAIVMFFLLLLILCISLSKLNRKKKMINEEETGNQNRESN